MKLSGKPIQFGIKEGVFFLNISMKMLLALFFYLSSFILWTGIIARNDISLVVPFSSAIINVLSVIIGVFIFKEYLSIYKIIGILLAIFGVVLMNYG